MSEPNSTEQPGGAVIEIVERHSGRTKHPTSGAGSVILPNHLRINGVAVWATYDDPVTIHEIVLDGECKTPFQVTVSLLARALRVGETPSFNPAAEGGADSTDGAVVEIPDVPGDLAEGQLDKPWVLLNGNRLYLGQDGVVIQELRLNSLRDDARAVMVKVALLCRSLVVDDEPFKPITNAVLTSDAL